MKNKFRYLIIGIFSIISFIVCNAATLEKDLTYKKHTLNDTYKYGKITREFQWNKISKYLDRLDSFQGENIRFGTLKNYKNINGLPPVARQIAMEKYSDGSRPSVKDKFGNRRNQGIPLYIEGQMDRPERYAPDGSLVSIVSRDLENYKIKVEDMDGEWIVPARYVKEIEAKDFSKVVVVDRKNQNITTLEKVDNIWKIRSMNPASTGLDRPPYQLPTPLGVFVVQGKKLKMEYLKDGSHTEIDGYAPYASRFSGGGYIHGVPVNLPRTEMIEYSPTLGTTPRSHMCVRNATSHAKYVYEWAQTNKGIVIVIE
ncbi:L,D-transpeptidase [Cetobacterium somerae]|uniref:L,D-transpeptidase n=1 Tax=Cetobacterium sp. NK01 TaxID=2993530 RepID=UPI0021166FCC|nr:L,D-transpeptidase [Cetobacterium sp. NK01]MCQ8211343.1 L,D-transpeptidase [Cetobacterium sp. NK01]